MKTFIPLLALTLCGCFSDHKPQSFDRPAIYAGEGTSAVFGDPQIDVALVVEPDGDMITLRGNQAKDINIRYTYGDTIQ